MKKLCCLSLWLAGSVLHAQYLTVPNGSFESPATQFAGPDMDSWLKSPQPSWWDPNADGAWADNMGEFANTPESEPDHLDNCDGAQAAYLVAVPQLGIFQQLNATYQPGKSYTLTAALTSSSDEPLSPGAALELSEYYLDGSNNMVTVAATNVLYDTNVFTNINHLLDFQVTSPEVRTNDAWAGQKIGVAISSSVGFDYTAGGVWDADNVRLTAGPALLNPVWTNGQFSVTLLSYPGLSFDLLATPNVALPTTSWTSLGMFTNATGTTNIFVPATGPSQQFYTLKQQP